mmetsp:Transcript_14307/g.26346  ORF Transcript_14307/g.26346 Transcript_14307/m.26346 type:complete len:83 (+) Transcript_14307:752-1000(+)
MSLIKSTSDGSGISSKVDVGRMARRDWLSWHGAWAEESGGELRLPMRPKGGGKELNDGAPCRLDLLDELFDLVLPSSREWTT